MFLLVRILAMFDHIQGNNGPKSSQKGSFMDAELVQKSMKTFNLATTTAILMKITTIMYLHEYKWKTS